MYTGGCRFNRSLHVLAKDKVHCQVWVARPIQDMAEHDGLSQGGGCVDDDAAEVR